MDTSSALEALLILVPRAQTLPYISMACLVWHTYDWFIVLEQERKYVWKRKIAMGSVIYVLLRLLATGLLTYDFSSRVRRQDRSQDCRNFVYVSAASMGVLISLVQTLLQGRVYALYHGNKKILWFNAIAFVVSAAVTAAEWSQQLQHVTVLDVPEPLRGCWVQVPRNMILGLIPAIVFELWLFALVLWKTFHEVRWTQTYHVTGLIRGSVSSVVFRDYFWWLSAAIGIITVHLSVSLALPDVYNEIATTPCHAAMCVSGCRMVLNIREAFEDVQKSGSAIQGSTQQLTNGVGVFGGQSTMTRASIGLFGGSDEEKTISQV